MKRQRWKAAFDKKDTDSNGYLDRKEIEAALVSSGVSPQRNQSIPF